MTPEEFTENALKIFELIREKEKEAYLKGRESMREEAAKEVGGCNHGKTHYCCEWGMAQGRVRALLLEGK